MHHAFLSLIKHNTTKKKKKKKKHGERDGSGLFRSSTSFGSSDRLLRHGQPSASSSRRRFLRLEPRHRLQPHPLQHLLLELPHRVAFCKLRPPVRQCGAGSVELRPVGAGHGVVHRGGVLDGRGDGGEQRRGRVDNELRDGDCQRVQAGGEEDQQVPADRGRPEHGEGELVVVAHRVAVVPAVHGVPDQRPPAAALPHLRRRPQEQPPFNGELLVGRARSRGRRQGELRRRRLDRWRRRRRGVGVRGGEDARDSGDARVGGAHAGGDRAGALLQELRPLLVLRAHHRAGDRVRAGRRRHHRGIPTGRRGRRRDQHPQAPWHLHPHRWLLAVDGVACSAGQDVEGEEVLELVPPLRRTDGDRRGIRQHLLRLAHRQGEQLLERGLRHLLGRLGARLHRPRDPEVQDQQRFVIMCVVRVPTNELIWYVLTCTCVMYSNARHVYILLPLTLLGEKNIFG